MKIAIDTSVLFSIVKSEPDGQGWLSALIRERKTGAQFVVCPIVYAELASGLESQRQLDLTLERLGIEFENIDADSAWKAGNTFFNYRKNGGPRTHLIPDFLIASHALIQCDSLAAIDRGFLRTYFSDLSLLKV